MEQASIELKSELRQHYRKIRQNIHAGDRQSWNTEITRQVLATPAIADAKKIFVYVSRWGEVCTDAIIQHLMDSNKHVLVPSPDDLTGPVSRLCELAETNRYTYEIVPCNGTKTVLPGDIDVILVPGIVWDRDGYRVGFGGGYFDRLLATLRHDALRLGLAFECQVVDEVPRDPWDEPVHKLITERGGL